MVDKPKKKKVKMVMEPNSRIISSTGTSDTYFGQLTEPLIKRKAEKFQTCAKPLEKPAAKRLKRAIGYESLAEETSKWENLIDSRRKESQSTFPINQSNISMVFKEKRKETSMNTDLEKEIYSLLADAKLVKEKTVTVEEQAITNAMKLSKVKERSAKLWKKTKMQKILEHRIGDKIFLRNKSKSKKTHRLMKKERLRDEKSDFRKLLEDDPAAALEKLEKIDFNRVQERMSLRHKSSKWIHTQTARSANDEQARQAVKENEEIRRELLEKLEHIKEVQQIFMDEDEQKKLLVNESIKNQILLDIQLLDEATKEEDDLEELRPTPKRLMLNDKIMADKSTEKTEENKEDIIDNLFAEDMEVEFTAEKLASEQDKVAVDEKKGKRAGWNSWAGPGIVEPVQKKTEKKTPKLNAKKKIRSNVILHTERDMNTLPKNTRLTKLPYPFTNVEEYEEYISKPIGRQFVTETSHKQLIAPPVVTKAGVVIDPIGEDSLIKHEKINPEKKTNRSKRRNKKMNKAIKVVK